ncbi:uncharacterized protein TrAFT101_000068 [Trichoderma asperellum]|uniref:uncharacterized protein n=1 Tax=Trichoderma asperellum TaxID=101201 RepID=UPI00331807E6|nr:hypothetical protein TrAFT101_000068 [Trichoderma asperellum]
MHFFPKADAALLSPSLEEQSLPTRPTNVGPIFDVDNAEIPIAPWTPDTESCFYPTKIDPYASASIPKKPPRAPSRYLRAHLAKNERLRLSMLWYYGRDLGNEPELLSGLQEKACLAQESSGWEFAIVGLLDVNVYIRLATVGVQLAILPRGETLCAHTVTQPPGNVFLLPNMMEDWRFRESPYVEQGGLIAYAGVPLRMQHESGECVGLGSLCVASATSQPPLSKQQQQTLARLADWIVADIVQCTRARRQRERHRLAELIATVENVSDDHDPQDSVLSILRTAYPDESISIQSSEIDQFANSRHSGLPSDLNNGLWEDTAYIDEFIETSNHSDTPKDRVVRIFSAQCESKLGHSILAVATKDFRRIFDDVDAWFIQTCASMLTQIWQKRLLSEAIRAKEKFLRGISHQLRTPIHGILGAAELLAEDLKAITISENAKIQPALAEVAGFISDIKTSSLYLDTISTAGRELMSTVNSMITLNRWADVAVAERHYATHDISELELELVKGISDAAIRDTGSTPSIFFHFDLPPDRRCLKTDLSLLRDSVLPLIINAIQNTSEGAVIVTSSKQPGTDAFVVDVEDTGCGIQPDDQSRIFELYEKGGEHSTGAGLGLPLATKFSTLLHGSIELISSRVDRGSHFRATFRDITYAASAVPLHKTVSALTYLPLRFHQVGADLPDLHLSSNFAKFLIRNGLTASESYKDSFTIVESGRDSKLTHSHVSSIPSEQVVIWLVPTSVDSGSLESLPNVIYASGPFSTLKLLSILEEADNLAMMINPAKRLARSNNTLAEDLNQGGTDSASSEEIYLTSDEGYSSLNGSPSLSSNGETSQTLEHGGESSLDWGLSSTHQSNEPAIWRRSTLPSTPARSAKPLTLVVDDNAINLRILQMYCKKRGLSCLSAADGKQAIEIFSKRQASHAAGDGAPIELILMDLQMPVCNGIDATYEMRSLEKQHGWKSSILFIVTGQDSEIDREAANAAGADDYLVKPIGMRSLDYGLKRYFPAFKN